MYEKLCIKNWRSRDARARHRAPNARALSITGYNIYFKIAKLDNNPKTKPLLIICIMYY